MFLVLAAFFSFSVIAGPGNGVLSAAETKVFHLTADQTLEQVRDEIRAWRAADSSRAETPVTVQVAPGTWTLAEPAVFGAADSFIHFKAEKPGESIFTRGRKIENVTLDDAGRFVAKIPTDSENWRFESLFVNGRRAIVAREPDAFYFYIEKPALGYYDADGKPVDTTRRAFAPRQEERALFERLAALPAPMAETKVKFFHSWESSLHRIDSYQAFQKGGGKVVTLTSDSPWKLDYWGRNLRYRVENFAEALDTPGEWFLAGDGTLTYMPLPGETPENTELYAPSAAVSPEKSGFLKIQGESEAIARLEKERAENRDAPQTSDTLYVRDMTFDGLVFTLDEYQLPHAGLASGQAAASSPISILVHSARDVWFKNGEISHTGGYALGFQNDCADCGVESVLMSDLGAGGVKIGGNPVSKRIRVRDCVIRDYGRHDAGAVGVWITSAQETEVIHNDISDGFYTGVSVGWVWGYAESPTRRNTIAFNRIHHIGKGVLSDMGGVYSLGVSPGTLVANNVIHDVWSYNRYGRGGWGLYTDEGSSEITLENNLVYRVHTGTFHQHYGRENVVRNNILALSDDGQIQRSRIENHTSFVFENNIVVWDKPPLLASNWKDGHFVMRNNLFWYCGEKTTDDIKAQKFFAGDTLELWQAKGHDTGSLLADPEFTDAQRGDFTFKNGEPNEAVQSIGFVPFDFAKSGVESDRMKTIAFDYAYAPVTFAPEPPLPEPLAVNETFEAFRLDPIPDAALAVESAENAANILAEGENHFLRLADSDQFKAGFNPHFCYSPNYKTGTVHFSFEVRLSAGTPLIVEGRTMVPPSYKIGPRLIFSDGKLMFGAQSLSIPVGKTVRAALDWTVGEKPAAEGTLRIELIDGLNDHGQTETLYDGTLAPLSSEFDSLDWIGFILPGTAGTADFDNIRLQNREDR